MAERSTPYLGFNFVVALDGVTDTDIVAGFSDASGLNNETVVAEYRAGNHPENHVRKFPAVSKCGDVTLKRGLGRHNDIWQWIEAVRTTGVAGKRDSVVIKLRDEAGNDVVKWTLRSVMPLKYTGPTLAAKGGADVAMEELVLSSEKIEFNLI
jgi:phage tail-like protein